MDSIAKIKNRSIKLVTEGVQKEYCRTAVLFYMLEGNAEFEYDNRNIKLKEADILVINRGTEYRMHGSDGLMIASLELTGRTFEWKI